MNIPPEMVLALGLVIGAGIYALIRRSLRSGKDGGRKKTGGPQNSTGSGAAGGTGVTGAMLTDDPDKAAALDKFKAAHIAARDKRQQLQKTVKEDPSRATKALRSMMKR